MALYHQRRFSWSIGGITSYRECVHWDMCVQSRILKRLLGTSWFLFLITLLSTFCHPVSVISREDTAKYSPGPEKMNRDAEDMLPGLSPIPEFVTSSFHMIYPLGVNQRSNPLESTRERYCHKESFKIGETSIQTFLTYRLLGWVVILIKKLINVFLKTM